MSGRGLLDATGSLIYSGACLAPGYRVDCGCACRGSGSLRRAGRAATRQSPRVNRIRKSTCGARRDGVTRVPQRPTRIIALIDLHRVVYGMIFLKGESRESATRGRFCIPCSVMCSAAGHSGHSHSATQCPRSPTAEACALGNDRIRANPVRSERDAEWSPSVTSSVLPPNGAQPPTGLNADIAAQEAPAAEVRSLSGWSGAWTKVDAPPWRCNAPPSLLVKFMH